MVIPAYPWREPTELTAGESLIFNRAYRNYPASAGWVLTYNLRGGIQAIQFVATSGQPTIDAFQVNVPAATTATWQPATYVIQASVTLPATGETHQVYEGDLHLAANLATKPGDAPEKTFAQSMVEMWESVLAGTASHDILQSRVEGTVIERMTPEQKWFYYGQWKQRRQNELDVIRAKGHQPSKNKIRPLFNVVQLGPFDGSSRGWPFVSNNNP